VTLPHHSEDVGVDVRSGMIFATRCDPQTKTVHEFGLTNEAARLLGQKLIAAAEFGDFTEPGGGIWNEIDCRAKGHVEKCKRIAEAIGATGWMSHEVQMVARAIL
jgi:hypothetical protein